MRKIKGMFVWGLAAAFFAAPAGAQDDIPETMMGMPLLFSDDFEDGADAWVPTDPDAWEVVVEDGNSVFSQHARSGYEPPYRSPYNIALIDDLWVSDFVMEVKAKQTGREYGHRDLCFFYNYLDPARFYYTHIASAADPHANSIFLVNGAPRVSIALMRNDGTQWTDGKYHTVRIVRNTGDGLIEVYFDDMAKPIMKAVDQTHTAGRLGIGSFDDTGRFDDVRVWGVKAESSAAE